MIQMMLPSNEMILLFAVARYINEIIDFNISLKTKILALRKLILYKESICFVPESNLKNQFRYKKKYRITQV